MAGIALAVYQAGMDFGISSSQSRDRYRASLSSTAVGHFLQIFSFLSVQASTFNLFRRSQILPSLLSLDSCGGACGSCRDHRRISRTGAEVMVGWRDEWFDLAYLLDVLFSVPY